MSLFREFAKEMRAQENLGELRPAEYRFSIDLAKRIRVALVNSDPDDIESEFLLQRLYDVENDQVILNQIFVDHLYDYLNGAQK